MAERTPTYSYADAMNIIQKNLGRNIEDGNAAFICNLGTNFLWNKYDWRETIDELPPFFLIPDEQDHGAPQVTIPSNFMGLRTATLMRTATAPPTRTPLRVMKNLDTTHVRGWSSAITYRPEAAAFRIFPRVPINWGAPEWMIGGTYKIRPTKLVPTNLITTTLPFDDIYLGVWLEVLKWAAFSIAGDPRAGDVTRQNGQTIYTGQLAKAHAAADEMASTEGLELGDPIVSPSEPLVSTIGLAPNIFGTGYGF